MQSLDSNSSVDITTDDRNQHNLCTRPTQSVNVSENNAYWCSVKPESYSCLVKPSPIENPVAVNMRLLVLQWSERLGLKASKTKEDFLEDLQMDDD